MSICILGIYMFQGYWLYNSYQIRSEQFSKDINEAMRTAVFNKQFSDVHRYIRYYNKDTNSAKPAGKSGAFRLEEIDMYKGRKVTYLRESNDTLMRDGPRELGLIQDSSTRGYADTLARRISDLIVLYNLYGDNANLKKLDSVFAGELRGRQIFTPYHIDTFHISFNNLARESFRDSVKRRSPQKTGKIPFNPASNLFVQASFESPLQHIILKMMWTMVSSLVMLVLTTICFIYMLQTILKQKKLSEVKNDFINNMTHELKTPIATVYAAVEAMQNFNALHDQRKTETYLNISKQELQRRLSDLVEEVLQIAVEDKEELELFLEETDLNDLVDNIITNHQLKSPKPVQFRYDNYMEHPLVLVDKTHLANAVSNLVDNAIKYSGDQPFVHIQCRRMNGILRISVKDNGVGIPKAYQQNIFDKFFRVPTGNLHNVKGFGLGLSYVQKIVALHGGAVRVESEPGKGSEFIIEMPL